MCKKTEKLEAYIEKNLNRVLAEETKQTLGDRSQYIGASDIGGCPFKTVMSKKNPPKHSLKQQIIFQRGHLAEDLVSKMLDGLPQENQVEAISKLSEIPLKAHLDKLIKSSNRCVVIEIKTVSAPVNEPYESWVLQVQFQMGLMLEKCGHEVEGFVIAIDLNSGWLKTFAMEFDETLFQLCLNKAKHIEDALLGHVEPKAIVQYYCSTCPFKMVCPKQGKFAEELPEEVAADIERYKTAKRELKNATLGKERAKKYLVEMNIDSAKNETSQTVVTLREQSRGSFDFAAFKKDYPDLYKKYHKETKSFVMSII